MPGLRCNLWTLPITPWDHPCLRWVLPTCHPWVQCQEQGQCLSAWEEQGWEAQEPVSPAETTLVIPAVLAAEEPSTPRTTGGATPTPSHPTGRTQSSLVSDRKYFKLSWLHLILKVCIEIILNFLLKYFLPINILLQWRLHISDHSWQFRIFYKLIFISTSGKINNSDLAADNDSRVHCHILRGV